MSDSPFTFIDKNIKQQFVPFRIDGNNLSSVQYFNYYRKNTIETPNCVINILPESFKLYVKSDISYILQYSIDSEIKKNKNSFTVDNLLSKFPKILIREYGLDSTIDAILNMFSSFGSGWSSGVEAANKIFENSNDIKETLTKWKNDAKEARKDNGNIVNALEATAKDIIKNNSPFADMIKTPEHSSIILDLPYLIYYRLISTSTQNVYELPYIHKEIYDNKGSTGWESNKGFGLDFGDGEKRTILKAIAPILKNLKINAQPIWKPGQDSDLAGFDIKIDLFNDTIDSAISNFVFINTLLPNNMWMLYGIYQYSPNLYDIQIDGNRRLFMCCCDISVGTRGILRIPSDEFFFRIGSYINENTFNKNLLQLHLKLTTRIPDVYTVSMKFSSLLPQNFNNYLFEYAIKDSPYTLAKTNDGLIKGISYEEIISKLKEKLK